MDGDERDDERWMDREMDRRILSLMDVDVPMFRTLDDGPDDHIVRFRTEHGKEQMVT